MTRLGVVDLPLLPRLDVPSPLDVVNHILAWPRNVAPDVQLLHREYERSLACLWRRQGEDEENAWHGARAPFDDDVRGPGHQTHSASLDIAVVQSIYSASRRLSVALMDLGEVSESDIDELYHTTYAALLSNRAQALGDYCHIAVARLPYTTLPHRLDLVPEKRYVLPQHLRQLLVELLRGLPETLVDAALRSEAHDRFCGTLSKTCEAHRENGFAEDSVCRKLQLILDESQTL